MKNTIITIALVLLSFISNSQVITVYLDTCQFFEHSALISTPQAIESGELVYKKLYEHKPNFVVKYDINRKVECHSGLENQIIEVNTSTNILDIVVQQGKQTSDKHLVEVIKNIETEIGTAGTSLAIQTEKLKVSQEMEMILSDNGMKRMLMSQIIPLLNKKILKTAKVLEFKFAFEFDLEFNPIITHLGMQVSPDSLSSGEQKKMNLIVLLCILELIKLKHNKVNLLFLDEVFSSLDVDSIFRVVDLLKTFSKKYNMTVFVISHDPLPEEYFDTKIQVENTDHFSDLTII
jgi:DNA repair exonuclease SbcCD ATPase subunit